MPRVRRSEAALLLDEVDESKDEVVTWSYESLGDSGEE